MLRFCQFAAFAACLGWLTIGCNSPKSKTTAENTFTGATKGRKSPDEKSPAGKTSQSKTSGGAPSANDPGPNTAKAAGAKTRKFRFVYGATITKLPPGATAHVWLPVATGSSVQQIERVKVTVPGEFRETKERNFGNDLIYFEAVANDQGEIPVDVEYLVGRKELLMDAGDQVADEIRGQFLLGSTMVPIDASLTEQLLGTEPPQGSPLEVARAVYNAVDDRMKYDKPAGGKWGRGDSRWACDSKYGNCTDFHSLYISVCRHLGIPAKFEIGFPIPTTRGTGEVGGYHCWAQFAADGRWVPVDISEADKNPAMKQYYFGNLTPDRVTFTTGRDLQLDPPQKAGPVNFLVYPYVEVDGQPHTSFMKRFRYEDVE